MCHKECSEVSPCVTGTCSPVLQPEARWAEGWGVGWLNFHGKLVREVQKGDEKEVCRRMPMILLLFLLLFLCLCHTDAPAWPHGMVSL